MLVNQTENADCDWFLILMYRKENSSCSEYTPGTFSHKINTEEVLSLEQKTDSRYVCKSIHLVDRKSGLDLAKYLVEATLLIKK